MDCFVEKLHIEASGQAAIGVYEQRGGRMLKKDYKAHVTTNRFDLTPFSISRYKK